MAFSFGNTSTPAKPTVFGQTSAFGVQNQTFGGTATTAPSLFGGQATISSQAAPPAFGAFGQPTTSAPAFGSFQQSAPTTSAPAFGFGGTTNTFGQQSAFGSAFGATPAKTTGSLFSGFGTTTQPAQQSAFGGFGTSLGGGAFVFCLRFSVFFLIFFSIFRNFNLWTASAGWLWIMCRFSGSATASTAAH